MEVEDQKTDVSDFRQNVCFGVIFFFFFFTSLSESFAC